MTGLFDKLFLQTVFARLMLVFILLAGTGAAMTMIIENNPDLEIPQMVVTIEWPGASSSQIEKEIINKAEKKIKGIKGLKKYASGSFNSFGIITVEFNADMDIPVARQRLKARLDEARSEFPDAAKAPKIEEVSVSDIPIVSFMLHGALDNETMATVSEHVKRKLENLKGVKKIELAGETKKVVHIRMISDRLRALAISPITVRDRLQAANIDAPWGKFEGDHQEYQINLNERFADIERLKKLPIVKLSDNRTVLLKEIADVYLGTQRLKSLSAYSVDGQPFENGVNVSVFKRPGADALLWIETAKQEMEKISQSSVWPQALNYSVSSDESEQIDQAFGDMFSNMWQAMVLVFIVLFVIMTWREALIAGMAIPLTFLASLILLAATGYTLNSIVLIGMVMALGMLVDVFILVMDGMNDSLNNKKMSMSDAIRNTVKSYALPAFAGQLTTILAMAPLMAIGGLDGKFIRQIPMAVVYCLIFSFIIAFIISVPLSRYLLKEKTDNSKADSGFFDRLMQASSQRVHSWILTGPLASKRRSGVYVGITVVAFIGSMILAGFLQSEMYPKADGRNLGITLELHPNTELQESRRIAEKVGDYLRQQPYFSDITMLVGAQSPFARTSLSDNLLPEESEHLVGFSVRFTPKDERQKLAYQYLPEISNGIHQSLKNEPGWNLILTPQVGGSNAQDPVQIEITGPDVKQLQTLAQQIKQKLEQIPGTTDARDNIGALRNEVEIFYDHDALNYFGLSEDDVSDQVRLALENDEIGKFKRDGILEDYPIHLGTEWPSRNKHVGGPTTDEEFMLMKVLNSEGQDISLSLLTRYRVEQKPVTLIHSQGMRAVTISAKTQDRTVAEILADIQPQLDTLVGGYGDQYQYRFRGEAESSEEAYGNIGSVFILAMFLVFAVLTLLFNSFRQPLIILVTIPFAMIGVFGGFFLFGMNMSFPAMIGIVSLVGIVVNNAIVMVEYINQQTKLGMSAVMAAAAGTRDRFRPIISTSLTTTLGLIPLAMSDPQWYPLCMAIVFGLTSSTVITLVIIPCIYHLLAPAQKEQV